MVTLEDQDDDGDDFGDFGDFEDAGQSTADPPTITQS